MVKSPTEHSDDVKLFEEVRLAAAKLMLDDNVSEENYYIDQ